MLAYWQIAHSTDARRAVLSTGATYNDMLHALMLSRGIDPSEALNQRSKIGGPAPGGSRPPPARLALTVHGGRQTQAHRDVATGWHKANMPRDWSKRTGSSASAIRWAMDTEN